MRCARKGCGWSLRGAAAAANISPAALAEIEAGGGLRVKTLLALADAYEIRSIDALFRAATP